MKGGDNMIKKAWSNPEYSNLGIERTEAGGTEVTTHDGKIYRDPRTGLPVEEYKS